MSSRDHILNKCAACQAQISFDNSFTGYIELEGRRYLHLLCTECYGDHANGHAIQVEAKVRKTMMIWKAAFCRQDDLNQISAGEIALRVQDIMHAIVQRNTNENAHLWSDIGTMLMAASISIFEAFGHVVEFTSIPRGQDAIGMHYLTEVQDAEAGPEPEKEVADEPGTHIGLARGPIHS